MPASEQEITLQLTTSEAVVLSELLLRYQLTSSLDLAHPSEYLSLLALSRKLEGSLLFPLTCDYQAILTTAQADLLHGFEGRVPGLAGSV